MTTRQIVHFLHIGKTGGSAVKHALQDHLSSETFVIELHWHDTRLRDVADGHRVFFFVRDPVSRFVSGFNSRKRQGQPRYFMPWRSGEAEAFAEFVTPNALALALFAIDPALRARAVKAMECIYHMRISYWDWFESEAYFRSRLADVLLIGFQETLASDFECLKVKLGLPQSVQLPTDDIQAHRNPADLDTHLDQAAVENLKTWYARDYAFLRLCQELAPQVNAAESQFA